MRYTPEEQKSLLAYCGFHSGIDFSGCSEAVTDKICDTLLYLKNTVPREQLLNDPAHKEKAHE